MAGLLAGYSRERVEKLTTQLQNEPRRARQKDCAGAVLWT